MTATKLEVRQLTHSHPIADNPIPIKFWRAQRHSYETVWFILPEP